MKSVLFALFVIHVCCSENNSSTFKPLTINVPNQKTPNMKFTIFNSKTSKCETSQIETSVACNTEKDLLEYIDHWKKKMPDDIHVEKKALMVLGLTG